MAVSTGGDTRIGRDANVKSRQNDAIMLATFNAEMSENVSSRRPLMSSDNEVAHSQTLIGRSNSLGQRSHCCGSIQSRWPAIRSALGRDRLPCRDPLPPTIHGSFCSLVPSLSLAVRPARSPCLHRAVFISLKPSFSSFSSLPFSPFASPAHHPSFSPFSLFLRGVDSASSLSLPRS